VFTALLLVLSTPISASAYATTGCSWRDLFLYIDYRYVNGNFRTAFQQAASRYTYSTDMDLYPSDSGGNSFTAEHSNYGATGWEGYSTWSCNWFSRTTAATAKLNQYYPSGFEPITRLKVVWEHELGHGIGLAHVGTVQRVMYSSASDAYFSGVTDLTFDEINGVNALY